MIQYMITIIKLIACVLASKSNLRRLNAIRVLFDEELVRDKSIS